MASHLGINFSIRLNYHKKITLIHPDLLMKQTQIKLMKSIGTQ